MGASAVKKSSTGFANSVRRLVDSPDVHTQTWAINRGWHHLVKYFAQVLTVVKC